MSRIPLFLPSDDDDDDTPDLEVVSSEDEAEADEYSSWDSESAFSGEDSGLDGMYAMQSFAFRG